MFGFDKFIFYIAKFYTASTRVHSSHSISCTCIFIPNLLNHDCEIYQNTHQQNPSKCYTKELSPSLSWHHTHITPPSMDFRNVRIFSSHAHEYITPKILTVVSLSHRCAGIPQDEVGRDAGRVPHTLANLPAELSRDPRSVSLDKEGMVGVKVSPTDFIHELLGPADEYTWGHLFRPFHLAKSVENGVLLRQYRPAVGDGSSIEGKLKGEVNIGGGLARHLVKISWHGTGCVCEEQHVQRIEVIRLVADSF